MAPKKMVVLGEHHGAASIVQLQTRIQERMAESLHIPPIVAPGNDDGVTNHNRDARPKVRVIMEHFSMDMQGILNQYHNGMLDTQGMMKAYQAVGTEGHNLIPYIPALESAITNDNLRLYGGFIPRPYARMLMQDGVDKAIEEASTAGYIPKGETLDGTDAHYLFFESLLTGRNMHMDAKGDLATDRFRKMFPAQIIKDASMAWCASSLDRILNITGHDKMLIVCGVGHMLYSHGVPERILANCNDSSLHVVKSKDDMLRIACLPVSEGKLSGDYSESPSEEVVSILKDAYGGAESNAADICFMYEETLQNSDDEDEEIRKETQAAYDRVGNTAHLEGGNMKKAHGILTSLNYTQEEIDYAGVDAVNYQGVGCPHRYVQIQPGHAVLDMGSGLGVDSLIATNAVGSTGKVVGVDISNECVQHANKRAKERDLAERLRFVQSPIESIGDKLEDDGKEGFDVIISNGAFCLLPNKKAGFAECYRLLKDGGKISICTTVIKDTLEEGLEWPLCMQTFAKMDELVPMLESLGFVNIEIDMSDSLMEVVEEEEIMSEKNDAGDSETESTREEENEPAITRDEQDNAEEGRFKVHNEDGQKQFRHLENFDMNQLCARVVIKATKKQSQPRS